MSETIADAMFEAAKVLAELETLRRDLASERAETKRLRDALGRINEHAHHHPGCRGAGKYLVCSEYCPVGIARAALAAPAVPVADGPPDEAEAVVSLGFLTCVSPPAVPVTPRQRGTFEVFDGNKWLTVPGHTNVVKNADGSLSCLSQFGRSTFETWRVDAATPATPVVPTPESRPQLLGADAEFMLEHLRKEIGAAPTADPGDRLRDDHMETIKLAQALLEGYRKVAAQRDEARARVAMAEGLLRACMWRDGAIDAYDTDDHRCICCALGAPEHAPDCKLAAFLAPPNPPIPAPPTPTRLRDDQWLRGWLHRFALDYTKKGGDVTKDLDAALDAIELHLAELVVMSLPAEPPIPAPAALGGGEKPTLSRRAEAAKAAMKVDCPKCGAKAGVWCPVQGWRTAICDERFAVVATTEDGRGRHVATCILDGNSPWTCAPGCPVADGIPYQDGAFTMSIKVSPDAARDLFGIEAATPPGPPTGEARLGICPKCGDHLPIWPNANVILERKDYQPCPSCTRPTGEATCGTCGDRPYVDRATGENRECHACSREGGR